jgi:hypothetical protein
MQEKVNECLINNNIENKSLRNNNIIIIGIKKKYFNFIFLNLTIF